MMFTLFRLLSDCLFNLIHLQISNRWIDMKYVAIANSGKCSFFINFAPTTILFE